MAHLIVLALVLVVGAALIALALLVRIVAELDDTLARFDGPPPAVVAGDVATPRLRVIPGGKTA